VLLAFDTSTPLVSVAVCDDHGEPLAQALGDRPMAHGESLAPMIEQALRAAGGGTEQLSTIAVGTGPGPFTGLRVGLVTARMLGLALGVPVRGVCSLDVVAAQAVAEGVSEPFVVVSDARRKELFHAAYGAEGQRLDGPGVSRPADVLPTGADTLVVGPGARVHPDAFARTAGPDHVAAARLGSLVARGGAQVTAPDPLYLRRPDAVVPGPPKMAS
jgi:tRNA threonylcarbamoyladenosine biosynthesis protein TsaB